MYAAETALMVVVEMGESPEAVSVAFEIASKLASTSTYALPWVLLGSMYWVLDIVTATEWFTVAVTSLGSVKVMTVANWSLVRA